MDESVAGLEPGPPEDPQQNRVYHMEQQTIQCHYACLSQQRIRRLVRRLAENYDVPCPVIKFEPIEEMAAFWTKPGTIIFADKSEESRSIMTVAHEFAHHLHFCIATDIESQHEAHGIEFMACYMSILDTVRCLPNYAMGVVCDRYGVKYLDPGPTLASLTQAVLGSQSHRQCTMNC